MTDRHAPSDDEMPLDLASRRRTIHWIVIVLLTIMTLSAFPIFVYLGELIGYNRRNANAAFSLATFASPFICGAATIVYSRWALKKSRRDQSAGQAAAFKGISIALIVLLCAFGALIAGVIAMLWYANQPH